jgi:hypothetical protein
VASPAKGKTKRGDEIMPGTTFGNAKLVLEINPDGTITADHGFDGTVLFTGKAASPEAWNNIIAAIVQNTVGGIGELVGKAS